MSSSPPVSTPVADTVDTTMADAVEHDMAKLCSSSSSEQEVCVSHHSEFLSLCAPESVLQLCSNSIPSALGKYLCEEEEAVFERLWQHHCRTLETVSDYLSANSPREREYPVVFACDTCPKTNTMIDHVPASDLSGYALVFFVLNFEETQAFAFRPVVPLNLRDYHVNLFHCPCEALRMAEYAVSKQHLTMPTKMKPHTLCAALARSIPCLCTLRQLLTSAPTPTFAR